jgi:hypothetical protein
MKHVFLFIILLHFLGCDFMEDLANMNPPEVTSFSPGTSSVDAGTLTSVSISFSENMDKTKSENAFTLMENGTGVNGYFSWEGKTMNFVPFAGIHHNKEYEMGLSSDAEDEYGNSLSDSFNFKFYTKDELGPPEIINTSPANGENIAGLWQEIIVIFSEPVNKQSFYSAFNIKPDVSGSFSWNEDNSAATFNPTENYKQGEEYRVEINTALTDNSGNNMAEAYYFYFTSGDVQEQAVTAVTASDNGSVILDTTLLAFNNGIEKDESFEITFLYPVSTNERNTIIDVFPSVQHNIQWDEGYSSCTLSFNEHLVYGSYYEINILDSTYRLNVNDISCIPPEIVMTAYCPSISANPPVELLLNDTISIVEADTQCFDIYIQHAQGYPVRISSFLDSFDISWTSSSLSDISYTHFENSSSGVITEPPGLLAGPPPSANTEIQIIRVYCDIVSGPDPGIITISINSDLADINNNYLKEDYILTVLK